MPNMSEWSTASPQDPNDSIQEGIKTTAKSTESSVHFQEANKYICVSRI